MQDGKSSLDLSSIFLSHPIVVLLKRPFDPKSQRKEKKKTSNMLRELTEQRTTHTSDKVEPMELTICDQQTRYLPPRRITSRLLRVLYS